MLNASSANDSHGPRAPQRQHVARVDAVALNRGVVGDALDDPPGNPPDPLVACVVGVELGVAAPVDRVMHVGLGDLPRVSVGQPVVGLLDLPAVVDLLVEDAELVADAVADRWGAPAWPASPGSRPQGGRGRRCRAPAPPRTPALPRSRGRVPSSAVRAASSIPRFSRLLPS